MPAKEEVIGNKYGLISVIADAKREENSNCRRVLGKCDCGTVKTFRLSQLKRSKNANCGCYKREQFIHRQTKHGDAKKRLYKIWHGMRSRCYNENDTKYELYGGKGIKVCDEWINDFKAFEKWSSENGYSENLTIDRIDSNKNYEPSNCRWADIIIQNRNRKNCWYITINGVTKLAIDWAKENRINESTIFSRRRKGWSDIDCVTRPVIGKGARGY